MRYFKPSAGKASLFPADIFQPQMRIIVYEFVHHPDAVPVLQNGHLYAALPQKFFFALERPVFAYHHAADAVKHYRAAAHHARRDGGIECTCVIYACRLTAGVFYGGNRGVKYRIAALYAPVMASADYFVMINKHCTNRYAAVGKASPGFDDGLVHESVVHIPLLIGGVQIHDICPAIKFTL